MRKLIATMSLALLLAGCGEDIEIPKMIDCDGCKEEVSSKAEDCPSCGHPIADSVDAYKRQEEERKEREEWDIIWSYGGPEVLAKIKEAKESDATELRLGDNGISDLLPLAELTHLKQLDLGDNEIVDISELEWLTNLEYLNLANNSISDISPLKRMSRLKHLNLQWNQISDTTPLKWLTNLEKLVLDNSFTVDQIEMLKKALPDCEIEF